MAASPRRLRSPPSDRSLRERDVHLVHVSTKFTSDWRGITPISTANMRRAQSLNRSQRLLVDRCIRRKRVGLGTHASAELLEPAFADGARCELGSRCHVVAFEETTQVRLHGPSADLEARPDLIVR